MMLVTLFLMLLLAEEEFLKKNANYVSKEIRISRNDAKVFICSQFYRAGIAHTFQLLMKADPKVSKEESTKLAKKLYTSTKGIKSYAEKMFGSKFWFGGTESYLLNKLEEIVVADNPETLALCCGITRALRKCHIPGSNDDKILKTNQSLLL
ncbi:hypothetical protein PPACK8108_LOCUS22170 [Phakopsora pachyrhizi]|uniref:Uncharacterized protein n=1 Tax=Phakopsora pachyrhizi TaxID=170000 RepID=A0AAV0BJ94_PHAPC|nr:hypothetical protein PPACK8108_LOCUS22170 [Phakopsora pachyrhizi]